MSGLAASLARCTEDDTHAPTLGFKLKVAVPIWVPPELEDAPGAGEELPDPGRETTAVHFPPASATFGWGLAHTPLPLVTPDTAFGARKSPSLPRTADDGDADERDADKSGVGMRVSTRRMSCTLR